MDILKIRKQYPKAIDLPFEPFYTNSTETGTYNDTRRLKLLVLSDTLSKYKEFEDKPYNDKIEIIMRIENSCANETIRKARGYNLRVTWENEQFINIYHSICYHITSKIDEVESLVKKILNKEIELNIIANMSSKDLVPEEYDDIASKVNKRTMIEINNKKFTELHFCKKCKRNQTTVERIQNRSLDEGSSFIVTCIFCGTKWFT